jgi:hypothetical protein
MSNNSAQGGPDRNPIILVAMDDPEQKPKLFACRTCGRGYSVKEIGTEAARDFANNCTNCFPKQYACDMCGCETRQYWTRCDSCLYAAKLEAATEVPDDGGPYCAFDGDTYYTELDQAADDACLWVSPCHVTYPKIDADAVLDGLLSDMYEDATIDDLDGVTEFYAAVKAFNEAQRTQSWWGDDKRKIKVPDALLSERSKGEGND